LDWAAALREHEPWLRTVVGARLREWDAVDDVMQEIAVKVLRRPGALHDATKVAPWLYRIAIRQVLLYRRSMGRRRARLRKVAEQLAPEPDVVDEVDPLVWLIVAETRSRVRDSLECLCGQDRELLMLRHVQRWTYQQVADHLGLGVDKVIYRLARARKRLRAIWITEEMSKQSHEC
jgi:RNA polymerase sigma-70 factor (ECF subfamily)